MTAQSKLLVSRDWLNDGKVPYSCLVRRSNSLAKRNRLRLVRNHSTD
jgi:hypothetical protein